MGEAMDPSSRRGANMKKFIAVCLLPPLLLGGGPGGCATIMRPNSKDVTFDIRPQGGTVSFEGRQVRDGETISIRRDFDTPQVNVGGEESPYMRTLQYQPDLWIVGDILLLIPFFLPGVAALAIDFATGAWRNLDERQIVTLYSSPSPSPAVEPAVPPPQPTLRDQPTPKAQPTPAPTPADPDPPKQKPPDPEITPIQP
jgi:hypothetical protein